MLFLLIVALIATPAFYKRSRAMGTASGRLASVPFMVLAGFLAVDYVARLAVSWTTAAAGDLLAWPAALFSRSTYL